jgi:hypothetical protein
MKPFRFEVAMHEDYGELGLRPKWYPTGDPLGGMAAAHDILEHFPNDDGSTEGELMALGASLHVRQDGGATTDGPYSRPFTDRDVEADFPTLWCYNLDREDGRALRTAPRVQDADAVERARAIAREGLRLVRTKYGETDEDGEERLTFSDDEINQWAAWLAYGYVRAQRRYRHVIGGVCALASLFMGIAREAERALKRAEEGMILTVHVNVTHHHYRVDCDYPKDHPYA